MVVCVGIDIHTVVVWYGTMPHVATSFFALVGMVWYHHIRPIDAGTTAVTL